MKIFTKRNSILISIILGVSVLSAVIGALFTSSYLDGYAESLENMGNELGVITSVKPHSSGGTERDVIAKVIERSNQSSMPIVNINDPIHNNGIVVSHVIGTATSLTTDGWIILPADIVAKYGNGVRVLFGGEMYKISEFIIDDATEFGFAKTNIANARVGTFGSSNALNVGDMVFAVSGDRIYPRTIVDTTFYDRETGVLSSDSLDREFLLDYSVDVVPGAMVMNSSGELVGILTSDLSVRPLSHIAPALEGVLLDGKIERPGIGIRYVDVSRVLYSGDDFREGLRVTKVANVDKPKGGELEVLDESLEVGDVIIKIQGRSVNELPLSEYVATGKVGDQLQLDVMRDETELEIFVTLE